ncbi:MAG: ATP-dependent Clp protease proteolytic subunit [Hyphomicrobiales bacterium]|nr:ATP-dependent Clp protease proteolytic subunit [Hyphomicrobiales bacterium]
MSAVTPHSTERLFSLINGAFRDGTNKIHLLLNSPGGSVFHGLAIYNMLKGIPLEIVTHNFGTVDSIGIIIYCAGKKRYCVPHARFLLHPVATNFQQGASADEHRIREIQNALEIDQKNIARIVGATTNKSEQEILKSIHNRETLDPEQAKKFGLVNSISSTLIPAGAHLEVIRESEANMPQIVAGQTLRADTAPHTIPLQLSPAPKSGATNIYKSVISSTKAF